MKYIFFFSAIAFAADVTGDWRVQTSAAGRQNESTCAFTQQGADVSGTCKSERGTVQFAGKVDGDRITWTYKSDSEGGPVTVVFKGKVASQDKMSGSVLAVEFNVEGEFTAARTK
jgi:hypothetical protein